MTTDPFPSLQLANNLNHYLQQRQKEKNIKYKQMATTTAVVRANKWNQNGSTDSTQCKVIAINDKMYGRVTSND